MRRGRVRDFQELKVWQLGHQLALDIYKITVPFPKAEEYGLRAQIRRAAVSVAANIAEGSARHTDAAMRQFLIIAHGSAAEVQCLIIVACDLGYLSQDQRNDLDARSRELRRGLNRFIGKLAPTSVGRNR